MKGTKKIKEKGVGGGGISRTRIGGRVLVGSKVSARTVTEATKARSTALAVTLHSLANSNQKRIADLAARNRLPAIYPRGDYVESGGLISYGPDQAESYRRAASMVDKILKGTKPADIPVEQPTKFELLINLKTAKALGLMIPPVVMMRAEKVIK